jgi:hypothetical protein
MLDDLIETPAAGGDIAPAVSAGSAIKFRGIAICGSYPVTKMQAPFADPTWKIMACSPDNTPYGMGQHASALPRVDDWCELHSPVERPSLPFGYMQYVSQLPVVWMRDQRAMASGLFKGARPYPERAMKEKFCSFLFSSSVAYMMALAITQCEEQGIPQIALYGIMQGGNLDPRAKNQSAEYAYQRPGTQYFIWEATRRGIKVLAAKESQLFELPPDVW